MPLYEYKCSACDDIFEVMQKFSEEPLRVHPGCGGAVERLLSAPALQFKGSGWYVTDYGRNGSTTAKEKPKSESSNGNKSEDTKPAASPAKGTSGVTKSE